MSWRVSRTLFSAVTVSPGSMAANPAGPGNPTGASAGRSSSRTSCTSWRRLVSTAPAAAAYAAAACGSPPGSSGGKGERRGTCRDTAAASSSYSRMYAMRCTVPRPPGGRTLRRAQGVSSRSRAGRLHTRTTLGVDTMKPKGQLGLWKGVMAVTVPSKYMGCGTKVPLHAKSHMGRAPQMKKPLCLGPGVPLSGSTYEMELKRVSRVETMPPMVPPCAASWCEVQSKGRRLNARAFASGTLR
mmetsp:Transcript_12463/g.34025  ORF Transcript_12463/g.34025 Transcript_12463/m.34025 type:complete len:242 (-) Transcript_12463:66-791(-)